MVSKEDILVEFERTQPVPSSPLPIDVPQLECQGAVDAKNVEVVVTCLPKKKRALTKAQKGESDTRTCHNTSTKKRKPKQNKMKCWILV